MAYSLSSEREIEYLMGTYAFVVDDGDFEGLGELLAALQPIASGRYTDRFVRVDGKWQFAARSVQTSLAGDLSHHRRA